MLRNRRPAVSRWSKATACAAKEEGEAYEVIVQSGKLVYRQNGAFVDTSEGIKWMFVLSTSRRLYVGQKKRGMFQHSSFVAGAAMIAAGRIVAHNGLLKAIWSYSGHYRPTEEHFMEIIQFLEEHHVDLNDVKKVPIDDGVPPVEINSNDSTSRNPLAANAPPQGSLLVAEQNVDVVASDLFNDLDKKCLIEQSALVKNTEEPARKYESQSLNLEHSRNQSTLQISSN
ncbi:calmodulin-binding family protein [Abeliophyllum distichum]|uniref:Calmodulin-binding family protein n=1 Tax=Abeliophyllum distichum TaxID=126358 RepID=A0ABD1VP48_9LAMI